MKTLLVCLLAILFVLPAPGCFNGAIGSDTSGIANTAVQATITVVPFAGAAGVFTYWVSQSLDNNMWGQIGYTYDTSGKAKAMWQVYDLNVSGTSAIGMGPQRRVRLNNGPHTFAMKLKSGTTWEFSVDNKNVGTFDMKSAASHGANMWALGEGLCSAPSQIVTFSNIQVLRFGAWTLVPSGFTFGGNYGVKGYLQDSSIAPGGFQLGGSIPITGGQLW